MPVDLSVFGRQKSVIDYDQLQQEFEFKKALAQASLAKSNYLDVDKLGEQSLFKAAAGLPLTPQEEAAARYADAKSGGIQFDPVTGSMIQKPSIASKLGVNLEGGIPPNNPMGVSGFNMPQQSVPAPNLDANNEFDKQFKAQFDSQAGNPKAQQQLAENYGKAKFTFNEEQAKSAGYADRMTADLPTLTDPAIVEATSSPWKKAVGDSLWGLGNYVVGSDYRVGKQAQLDFINAILRRESGAAISTGEYEKYGKQYFPQPGDDKVTLANKARNREIALSGVQRSAGPAYTKPVTIQDSKTAITPEAARAELKRRGHKI